MKVAVTSLGAAVAACESAPHEAVCPVCGGVVTLRRRRLMNNRGVSYFWRHESNAACARPVAFQRSAALPARPGT